MSVPLLAPVDPWRIEIVAVHAGSHSSSERSALRRDEARGLLTRVAHGAYVERTAFDSLGPEARHIVRMRALVAVTDAEITFSHWSAGVLQGLPVLWSRLDTLHVTFDEAGRRSGNGVTGHVFALGEREVVRFGPLRATGIGRTVVDIAGSSPFEEGVMAADGALRAGVPRALLTAAVEMAGPRRAGTRIGAVVLFAHPGAESAAESRYRSTAMRLGLEIPELQHRVTLADGSDVFVDAFHRRADAGVEVDGDRKYLDPAMAVEGTGRAIVAEKRREDEVRTRMRALARVGWMQAGSTAALRPVMTRIGVRPVHPRPTVSDHAAVAGAARPRFWQRSPQWRA